MAQPHDQGREQPRPNQDVRLISTESGDGIGAPHLPQTAAHSLGENRLLISLLGQSAVFLLEEVRQHFCVSLGDELVPAAQQLLPQFGVILDDAIVNDNDPPLTVSMGMGVDLVWQTMSGPSGVTQSQEPRGATIFHCVQQSLKLTLGLLYLDLSLQVQDGYAG